jgi:hypothetical protein
MRDEGLNHSRAWSMVDTLATVIGPRLTASPAFMRAATWARDHLSSWGLSDVHMESWPFGRGWELEKYTLEMTSPRFAPMIGYPDAWSAPTKGEIVGTPILSLGCRRIRSRNARRAQGDVLAQPMMTNFIREDRADPFGPTGASTRPRPVGGEARRRAAAATEAEDQTILHGERRRGAPFELRWHGTIFVRADSARTGAVHRRDRITQQPHSHAPRTRRVRV